MQAAASVTPKWVSGGRTVTSLKTTTAIGFQTNGAVIHSLTRWPAESRRPAAVFGAERPSIATVMRRGRRIAAIVSLAGRPSARRPVATLLDPARLRAAWFCFRKRLSWSGRPQVFARRPAGELDRFGEDLLTTDHRRFAVTAMARTAPPAGPTADRETDDGPRIASEPRSRCRAEFQAAAPPLWVPTQ